MPVLAKTALLLILSNVFMTFARVWAGLCPCGAVFFVFRR
jgi:uncharacterized protein (DUF486 family)